MSRYDKREITELDLKLEPKSIHRTFLKKRGVRRIEFFTTPKFLDISEENIESIGYETRIWSSGDRFYKIAAEEYGDPTLWWMIAYFNQKPTDAHVKLGEQIMIPINTDLIDNAVNR